MSDVGGDSGVDAGANGGGALGFDSPALTSTDDLRAGIAQSYGLSPYGQYSPTLAMGRAAAFHASIPRSEPNKSHERRHQYVLSSFVKSTLGVKVYQPTGFSVTRELQASDAMQEEQSARPDPSADPIDSVFNKNKPILDRKIKDAPRPEEEGRLVKETDLRRRAIHVNKGRKDENDFGQ
jgi:hypothetical protein